MNSKDSSCLVYFAEYSVVNHDVALQICILTAGMGTSVVNNGAVPVQPGTWSGENRGKVKWSMV